MTQFDQTADVVIMGGGPAGSSLAARLCRESRLSVAIIEKETFPRDRIGESFASPAIPCLAETGALQKVLESNTYIRKYGGYYNWSPPTPTTSFFRHQLWRQDGEHRWSIHVNRADFDGVLLAHAEACGASVAQNTPVSSVRPQGERTVVELATGKTIGCRYFVDASGRLNRTSPTNRRAWLSSYKNIAVWGHFRSGLPAQSLPGDWNIFREGGMSPIGCFAFDHGWCWYIPIPFRKNGGHEVCHSIGIVTDPKLISSGACNLTEMTGFLAQIRTVPLLCDLIRSIEPLYETLRVATNYSMIRPLMADFDERWLAIGDAAFFVDPLFSSGVSFAMMHAAAAAELIKATEDGGLTTSEQRGLWEGYSSFWRLVAQKFALSIDQWYLAIARNNPASVYWSERAEKAEISRHIDDFAWLLDTDFQSDLLHVMTRGTDRLDALEPDGSLMSVIRDVVARDPAPEALIRLRPEVVLQSSMTLNRNPCSAKPTAWEHAPFWRDPIAGLAETRRLFGPPEACLRIHLTDTDSRSGIECFDDQHVRPFLAALRNGWHSVESLQQQLDGMRWQLLQQMLANGLVETRQ